MYNFQTFGCSNESSPNSSRHFWNHKVRIYSNLHHCSVSWTITPLYFFSLNLIYFGQKLPIEVKFSDFWVVGWKFTKFLKSYLKPQVSFSLNFASLFNLMGDKSSVLSWNFNMIFTKGAHQSAKFQTFDCSGEVLQNLYFDRLLLLKVYKVSAKKVWRKYVSWYQKCCKIWRKTDLWLGKWYEEFGKFSSEHLKLSKLVFSWDPFVQSTKYMSYKFTEEL